MCNRSRFKGSKFKVKLIIPSCHCEARAGRKQDCIELKSKKMKKIAKRLTSEP